MLGGAPLNFSVSSLRLGNSVALLSAIGDDHRGRNALNAMREWDISTELIQQTGQQSTGAAIVSTDGYGNASFIIHRPAAFDCVSLDDAVLSRIRRFAPDWIYYGTLAHTTPEAEERLNRLLATTPTARCFYDINLREGHWNLELVQRLSLHATIIKLNEDEAETLYRLSKCQGPYSIEGFCRYWASAFGGEVICVTLGANGCAVWIDGMLHLCPGFAITVVDTVGAGDAFAAAFLHGFENHLPIDVLARKANALGAVVASCAGATPDWTTEKCQKMLHSLVHSAANAPS